MISDNWFLEIESTLFTLLQYELVEKESAPFPELSCTTSSENDSIEGVSDFPSLYVHMLPAPEVGQDLTNDTVNAVRVTLELQVFSNKNESQCRKIMAEAIKIMKRLRFNIPLFPDPQTANKKYYAVARFTRIVGGGDRDIVPEEE